MTGSNAILKNLSLSLNESIYAEDPCAWMPAVTTHIPDEWQKTVLTSEELEIILNCCRQSGKTEIAAVKAAHTARFKKRSLTVIVSATLNQAGILKRRVKMALGIANNAWQKISEYAVKEYNEFEKEYKLVRRNALSIELANNSRVVSIPASPDSVRGYSPDLIIMDEAAFIDENVYDAIRPMRAVKSVQLIVMSTPNAKFGFFYEEWTSKDPVWLKIKVSADDCYRVSKKFLQRELDKRGKNIVEREYYNRFLDIEGAIFTQDQIDSLFVQREDDEEIGKMHKSDKNMIAPGGLYGWR